MNNPLVNQAAMVLPVFLLSACLGGGGSFDLDSVDTEAPRPAPKYQDVSSETPQAQKDQGGYGFAMRFKRRNWYPKNKEDHKALSEADWEKLGAGKPDEFPQRNEILNMTDGILSESLQLGEGGKSRVEGYTDFQYVRSGYIYRNGVNKIDSQKKIALSGPDGYLFYKGSNPSQALPTGKAIYKGTWDYVTDAKEKQKFPQLGSSQAGDRYGALSAEEADVLRNKSEAQQGQTDFGLTSEFEVDFAAKTMTGALYRNNRITNNETENKAKQIKRYDIQADLHGNRFSGKATATDKPKNDETKEHPFVSDSSSLSGGFFGPKGEELGFRFLSDDQKVAVVGSAKTKDKLENGAAASGSTGAAASGGAADMPSENGKLTTVLDAVELKSGGKEVKNLDNFSNAAQLVVDGIMIPLLPKNSESESNQADKGKNGGTAFTRKFEHTPESDKKDTQAGTAENGNPAASNTAGDTNGKTKTYEVEVCCSNLNYLKYGMLTRKNSKSAMQAGENGSQADAKTEQVEQSMFLQGERTDEKEIPKEQQDIVYRGSWYGHIAGSTSWSGNASNATSGNRAEFTVNFDTKKINGKLTAENRQEATFTIEGTIQDNGFEGTAKTADLGFDLDQSNTTGTPKAYITNAKVQGGFYGPKAEELGGWFAYSDDKQTKNATDASGNGNSASSATVVFGAKRQQPVQ
ncbi:TPA: transferrin-binding protein-like solute binding protein [Neisseria meningitidis]|uniref:transferrin-binding protein-like solute binding protein n=1 Tax=Neisseria meningitidis TaxID=487 RepID=UPI00076672D5|nr:transferrin-binding protein-like solute binding protein [Neisseria meningitidis]MCL5696848.1 transferrin-binding protein-like solute binding protein [Neisseria meningitidis]MCL5699150.1 transferrin-binding protein-like solute binding protein [Neisseria meningitidis]MCL5761578.1 transferrin-binding protein-like solute binding protein [Neisseria meningitidis]MCL5836235.1 transferrin-binding protein-like solute binding protein [Neisseria meningitidis]MCL6123953.1 transferrin-binding protein-li